MIAGMVVSAVERARSDEGPLQPDPGEVVEARFFGANELRDEIAFPDHIRRALDAWIHQGRPAKERY